jgi:hypothetical protein
MLSRRQLTLYEDEFGGMEYMLHKVTLIQVGAEKYILVEDSELYHEQVRGFGIPDVLK